MSALGSSCPIALQRRFPGGFCHPSGGNSAVDARMSLADVSCERDGLSEHRGFSAG